MPDVRMAKAFNEWMRRYVEEPERFQHEISCVRQFLAAASAGEIPSYGDECAVYLAQIMGEAA